MPDATGLELTAQELRDADAESILGTVFHRGRAVLLVNPASVRGVIGRLHAKGYAFLASLHGSTTTRRSRASACSTSCST